MKQIPNDILVDKTVEYMIRNDLSDLPIEYNRGSEGHWSKICEMCLNRTDVTAKKKFIQIGREIHSTTEISFSKNCRTVTLANLLHMKIHRTTVLRLLVNDLRPFTNIFQMLNTRRYFCLFLNLKSIFPGSEEKY